MNKKSAILAATVAMCLLVCLNAVAQDPSSQPAKSQITSESAPPGTSTKGDAVDGLSDQDLQLLRKDVRSLKKQIVAINMDLPDTEAEKFWPIYDQYTAEMTRIYDSELALMQEYSQTYETMTGDQAETYLRKRAAVEESITQLRLGYIPVFRKIVTGRETTLFFQRDWRLGLMIDLQLAKVPLINQ
jgi:hypothetical protein